MNIVNVGYRSTNYYVLADTQPRLLVDAGWPGTLATMQASCKRMGIDLAGIPYQLATHYHPDHAGLVQELKSLGVQLLLLDTQLAGVPLMRTYVKPRDNYTDLEMIGNIRLSVDESRAFLKRIGIEGEIIATPGHSDDSVTLILDDGSAFTGDLTPLQLLPDDSEHPGHLSWNQIRARGVHTVYPGHGPVVHI